MSAEIMFFSERCTACGNCLSVCPNQAIILKDVSHESGRVHPNQSVVLEDCSPGMNRVHPNRSIDLKDNSPDVNRVYEIHTLREKCIACGACVNVCPSGAREVVGRVATSHELICEIMKDVIFYDSSGGGVTFSGGEPLLQPDFLLALLKECKEREIHTAVDTCGFVRWETLSMIVPYTDLILYDLKCIDAGLHFELTGKRNEIILENLTHLSKTHSNVTVRFPLIPSINDSDANIVSMGEFVSSLRGKGVSPHIDILPYHKMGADKYVRLGRVYSIPDTPRPTDEMVHAVRERLGKLGLETGIGGGGDDKKSSPA